MEMVMYLLKIKFKNSGETLLEQDERYTERKGANHRYYYLQTLFNTEGLELFNPKGKKLKEWNRSDA
jgi:hypothetical protein